MPRTTDVTIAFSLPGEDDTDDDYTVKVRYTPGTPGSHEVQGDGPEFEILDVNRDSKDARPRTPGEFEDALGNGKLREQFELEVEEQASAALAREMARAESFRDDERKDRRAERPTNDE